MDTSISSSPPQLDQQSVPDTDDPIDAAFKALLAQPSAVPAAEPAAPDTDAGTGTANAQLAPPPAVLPAVTGGASGIITSASQADLLAVLGVGPSDPGTGAPAQPFVPAITAGQAQALSAATNNTLIGALVALVVNDGAPAATTATPSNTPSNNGGTSPDPGTLAPGQSTASQAAILLAQQSGIQTNGSLSPPITVLSTPPSTPAADNGLQNGAKTIPTAGTSTAGTSTAGTSTDGPATAGSTTTPGTTTPGSTTPGSTATGTVDGSSDGTVDPGLVAPTATVVAAAAKLAAKTADAVVADEKPTGDRKQTDIDNEWAAAFAQTYAKLVQILTPLLDPHAGSAPNVAELEATSFGPNHGPTAQGSWVDTGDALQSSSSSTGSTGSTKQHSGKSDGTGRGTGTGTSGGGGTDRSDGTPASHHHDTASSTPTAEAPAKVVTTAWKVPGPMDEASTSALAHVLDSLIVPLGVQASHHRTDQSSTNGLAGSLALSSTQLALDATQLAESEAAESAAKAKAILAVQLANEARQFSIYNYANTLTLATQGTTVALVNATANNQERIQQTAAAHRIAAETIMKQQRNMIATPLREAVHPSSTGVTDPALAAAPVQVITQVPTPVSDMPGATTLGNAGVGVGASMGAPVAT